MFYLIMDFENLWYIIVFIIWFVWFWMYKFMGNYSESWCVEGWMGCDELVWVSCLVLYLYEFVVKVIKEKKKIWEKVGFLLILSFLFWFEKIWGKDFYLIFFVVIGFVLFIGFV